jgi:predicted phosphodiesterase
MKIDVVSDVHLEFGTYVPSNPNNSDVLVMAGDIVPIHLLKDNRKFIEYFEQCANLYKHIIYVFGNHEYYNGDIRLEFDNAKNLLGHIENLQIVNNEVVEIDDVNFFCGTMWTDCNKEDPITMLQLIQSMNDYHVIKDCSKAAMYGGIDYLTPEDTVLEFKLFKTFLTKALNSRNSDKKCIVVTHHLPSLKAVPEEYRRDYHMNGGYMANMEEFIMFRPYIKVWIYGHTHTPAEFKIGETTLINNARGYVKYERASDKYEPYLPKTIEV